MEVQASSGISDAGTISPYSLQTMYREGKNEPASKDCSFDVSADPSYYHCPSQK